MWKESYRIGVEQIDKQHIQLFQMTDELLQAIETGAGRDAYRRAILFLKDYVVSHFRDEEAYQMEIGYEGLISHQKAHRDFTDTVLAYEKKLIESDFDLRVVKDLAGTLTAWLIYHVADADQKITGKAVEAVSDTSDTLVDHFSSSVLDVLEKMAGLRADVMRQEKTLERQIEGDIYVEIGLTGDVMGCAVFGFTRELALKLMEMMTFIRPDQIDELVCSALAELANITSGNAAIQLEKRGIHCDIISPVISLAHDQPAGDIESVLIDTGLGGMEVALRK